MDRNAAHKTVEEEGEGGRRGGGRGGGRRWTEKQHIRQWRRGRRSRTRRMRRIEDQ